MDRGGEHSWRENMAKLTVVDPVVTGLRPVRKLGVNGMGLWTRIQQEFRVEDAAGVEMLTLACEALDRASTCRTQIDADGEVIRGKGGAVREHPALRHELSNRSFVVRTLARLGLDTEPLRAVGRPPRGGYG